MEQDQQPTEECNDIIVETVAIGFPNGSLLYTKYSPFFQGLNFNQKKIPNLSEEYDCELRMLLNRSRATLG